MLYTRFKLQCPFPTASCTGTPSGRVTYPSYLCVQQVEPFRTGCRDAMASVPALLVLALQRGLVMAIAALEVFTFSQKLVVSAVRDPSAERCHRLQLQLQASYELRPPNANTAGLVPRRIALPACTMGLLRFISRVDCLGRWSLSHSFVMSKRYQSAFAADELQKLQVRAQRFRGRLHVPSNGSTTAEGGPTRPRTIVLAVGWAESTLKAMAKYAPMYTAVGLPYLCVAPSVVHMWSTRLGNGITSRILDAFDASLSSEPCSLVLHLFSGGGTTFFPIACEYFEKPSSVFHRKVKPVCVIFDSAPAQFSYESGTAAAKLMYQQGGMNFLTYRVATTTGIFVNKFCGEKMRAELRHAMQSSRLLDLPQLYLYSESDTVCPPSRVKAIIAEQREKGRDVSSHCWADSEHVRHFVNHPEEYKEQVVRFLKKHSVIH